MKKSIVLLVILVSILSSCNSGSKSKLDPNSISTFDLSTQRLIEQIDPDLVDINFFVSHKTYYITDFNNDYFFVVVKGKITKHDEENLNDLLKEFKEIGGSSKYGEILLKDSIGHDIYVDNSSTPLTKTTKINDDLKISVGKEYYFFVTVAKATTGEEIYLTVQDLFEIK